MLFLVCRLRGWVARLAEGWVCAAGCLVLLSAGFCWWQNCLLDLGWDVTVGGI